MKYYLFCLTALMIFMVSCQQSELIEETFLTEEQVIRENDNDIEDRGASTWERYGSITRHNFFVQNNIWNKNAPGGGNQKVWVNDVHNWGVNTYHQLGDGAVKSYPAIVVGKHYGHAASSMRGLPKKVANLGNMWCNWEQTNNMTKGNTSFDIWFHPTSDHGTTHEAQIEVMIWTQRKGQNPIADNYNANGAVPFATKWFNGDKYTIYKGRNGNGTYVYTFIKTKNDGKFRGNMKPFVNYCKSKGWIKDYHYLLSIQAGWEFVSGGNAKTTKFQLWGI